MKYDIGYIYAIWDIENPALIYYGSTGNLPQRMKEHKKSSRNKCSSKQIIERANYEYAIIETHENIDEYELVERESWYIRNKPCVNINVPHRTSAEYYQDNKDKKAEYYQKNKDKMAVYSAEYRQNNKEKLLMKSAEFRAVKIICDCGGRYTRQHKSEHEKSQGHINYIARLTTP